MAWGGTRAVVLSWPPTAQLAYWGVFLVALLTALYMALIDLRYIRLQYHLGERELFEETLGDEELRSSLRRHYPEPPQPPSGRDSA
jgi:hypothetical protein